MGSLDIFQEIFPVCTLGACVAYAMRHGRVAFWTKFCLSKVLQCNALHLLWYMLDIHKHFGPWKSSEPISHLQFAFKSSWIVVLYSIQLLLWAEVCQFDFPKKFIDWRLLTWELPEEYHFIKSTTIYSDIFWGILFFYLMDFWRYVAHRMGHYSFFFKTFPFAHAHHHNQLFVNPFTTTMSPLAHLASWGTFLPLLFMGAIGLHRSSVYTFMLSYFPTLTQHLGCDPLPWLTRINHYYCYGAIPWIPMYHAYHHNPFVKTGCFGNTTVLFDYIFDSVQPECVYHIENGHMCEKVAARFEDKKQLENVLSSMVSSGKGKNRFDLNEGYNWNMLSMNFK